MTAITLRNLTYELILTMCVLLRSDGVLLNCRFQKHKLGAYLLVMYADVDRMKFCCLAGLYWGLQYKCP